MSEDKKEAKVDVKDQDVVEAGKAGDTILTRDAMLGVQDMKIEKVYVEPWGGSVYIRTMSGRQKDDFDLSMYTVVPGTKGTKKERREVNLRNFRSRLIIATVCDEKGTLIFTDKDLIAIGRKSAVALDIIVDAARKLNGITVEEQDEMIENLSEPQDEETDLESV